jgi:hypothetical protein
MAIKSDDSDMRPAWFSVELGGNGDYYLTTVEKKDVFNHKGELENLNVVSSVRVGGYHSGGIAPLEVRLAVAALYRALEQAGLNEHPILQLRREGSE